MKKFLGVLLTLVMVLTLVPTFCFAENKATMSTSDTARAGQTFTVKVTLSGTVAAYSGELSYDSSLVTLVSAKNADGTHWSSFKSNGATVYAERDEGSTDKTVFKATFKVNSGVSEGTEIKIVFEGDTTDGNADSAVTCSKTLTVAAPASDDCTLKSLTVSGQTLIPAFSKDTTIYSIDKVGFDVTKLDISATANDAGAKVSVSGADLVVGANTVEVKVTASNGDTKTYKINVTREQDPNYVASSGTQLTSIETSAGTLSPAFKLGQKEYVIYVPYEQETISITGTSTDTTIKDIEIVDEVLLKVGTNELYIKVTAEDDTVDTYTFYVVRMDEFGGVSTLGVPASLIGATGDETEEGEGTNSGITPVVLAAIAGGCLLFGFALGFVIFKNGKNGENGNNGGKHSRIRVEEEEEFEDIYSDFDHETLIEDIEDIENSGEPKSKKELKAERKMAKKAAKKEAKARKKAEKYEDFDEYDDIDEASIDDYLVEETEEKANPWEYKEEQQSTRPKYISYEEYIDNLEK